MLFMNNLYGLLCYGYGKYNNSINANLGDEIQSIAASYFLPRIDRMIDRERIADNSQYKGEKIKIIMNAWYQHDGNQWPPNCNLEPLFVAVHLNINNKCFSKNLFSDSSIAYLKKHGPIGARDIHTQNILLEHGIDSYFSGCITLTLPKNANIKKQEYVLCVDVKDEVVEFIKKKY